MVFKSHKKQLKTNLSIKLSNQVIQKVAEGEVSWNNN